jgi:hypothetical protein
MIKFYKRFLYKPEELFMPGILHRVSFLFIFLFIAASSFSQNITWLQGSWKGKSYLPGSDAAQYFALRLTVTEIKGKKFEGYLSTMEPYDTTIRYDAKINGEFFGDYLTIKSTKVFYVKNSPGSRWLLSCINCKPAKMMFALQDSKFTLKGAIEECYPQCTGINEFSKDIAEMSAEIQDSVYALLHIQKPQVVAVSNLDTVSKSTEAGTMVLQRTVLIPAGNVVRIKDNKIILAEQNLLASLKRTKPVLIVKAGNPPQKISVTDTSAAISRKDINTAAPKDTALVRIKFTGDTLANISKPVITVPAPKNTVALHDTLSLLPKDYAERKVSVVRTIAVNTDSIIIRVYDNGVVDGDIVSLVYNDKVVIDKLSLISRAFTVKIPVNITAVNKLVFYAHNLGEFPPNTARLEIIYGNKKEELTISSDYTVSSSVNIVYSK